MMRKQFVEVGTSEEAWQLCPWAAVVAACDGGFMAFESTNDYDTWQAQS
jgi:hypothetical protein